MSDKCLFLSALYSKVNVECSMYKNYVLESLHMLAYEKAKERNKQKWTITINDGKSEKGEDERRGSKIYTVLDVIPFDVFVVFCLSEYQERARRFEIFQVCILTFYQITMKTSIEETNKQASKKTDGTDERVNQ